jgi:hypothetical protein
VGPHAQAEGDREGAGEGGLSGVGRARTSTAPRAPAAPIPSRALAAAGPPARRDGRDGGVRRARRFAADPDALRQSVTAG